MPRNYYRDEETGRFISYADWQSRQQEDFEEEEQDFEDLDVWDEFGEEEMY